MATFPALVPATRSYSLGELTAAEQAWLSGLEVVSEFVGVPVAHRLTLAFPALDASERAQVEAHYAGQQGPLYPFDLPADVWCGHSAHADIDAGLTWRYAAPVDITDTDAGQADLTVTLLALRDSTPLLTADVAPWYGSAVPLVATGDPAPAVPRPAMSTPGLRSLSETVPTRPPAPTPTTGTAATSDPGAPGPGGASGQTDPLPLTPVPSTEPALQVAGGRQPEVGEMLTYTPQCTSYTTQRIQWFNRNGDLLTELYVSNKVLAIGTGPDEVVKTSYFVVETCSNGQQHVSNEIQVNPRSDDKPLIFNFRRGSKVKREDLNTWTATLQADGVWWSNAISGSETRPPRVDVRAAGGEIYRWDPTWPSGPPGGWRLDAQGPDVVAAQVVSISKDGTTTSQLQRTEITLPNGDTGYEWQLVNP